MKSRGSRVSKRRSRYGRVSKKRRRYGRVIKNEKILYIKPSTRRYKKYDAFIKTKGGNVRKIGFGDNRYEQFRDSTKMKKYSSKNHGDSVRRRSYFKRHSGRDKKSEALKIEFKKSGGKYNAKILSHKYLW